jgi:predicted small secreted protein
MDQKNRPSPDSISPRKSCTTGTMKRTMILVLAVVLAAFVFGGCQQTTAKDLIYAGTTLEEQFKTVQF